mgnify:CR=1 FL=1
MEFLTKNGVRVCFDNNFVDLTAATEATPPLLEFDNDDPPNLIRVCFDRYRIEKLPVAAGGGAAVRS